MSVFSRLSPLFVTPPADEADNADDIHPNGEVALAELKKKAASPNTVINMGPVQEQAARNASRRRVNEWARQMRNETESNPALAAEMRKRMANIAAAQTADRTNAARRAANTAGPRPSGGPILRTRLTERKRLPLSTVVEVPEMNGGRRKTKSKTKAKSKKHTKKSRRHK